MRIVSGNSIPVICENSIALFLLLIPRWERFGVPDEGSPRTGTTLDEPSSNPRPAEPNRGRVRAGFQEAMAQGAHAVPQRAPSDARSVRKLERHVFTPDFGVEEQSPPRLLRERLGSSAGELDSLARLVQSQLHVSISRMLDVP